MKKVINAIARALLSPEDKRWMRKKEPKRMMCLYRDNQRSIECPTCGHPVRHLTTTFYCPFCGQRLLMPSIGEVFETFKKQEENK